MSNNAHTELPYSDQESIYVLCACANYQYGDTAFICSAAIYQYSRSVLDISGCSPLQWMLDPCTESYLFAKQYLANVNSRHVPVTATEKEREVEQMQVAQVE